MKYLVMTEGICEKSLIDILLERNLFIYCTYQLVYEQVFHARQLTTVLKDMIDQLPFDERVEIIRVGDKLNDVLEVDKDYVDRIIKITKICIKPEFEILHILNERLYDDYLKVKSKISPSEFYKGKNKMYRKTYKINYDYFNALSDEQLLDLFENYKKKRIKSHRKEEGSILDLFK